MADFTVYATVPLGLAARDGDAAGYLAAAGLLGAFYLNAASWMYLAALAGEATTAGETPLTSIPMPTALIEGAETIAAYALFLAWPSGAVPVGFWVLAGLVMVGVGQRLLLAVRTLGARR